MVTMNSSASFSFYYYYFLPEKSNSDLCYRKFSGA